jgi:ubiquinone/menaquinone biosynthesis C-methylase UbiE
MNYLENKNKPLSILEAGCGNGWLSGRLAATRDSKLWGTDVNKTELEQAGRVFGDKSNITFIEGDIRDIHFKKGHFDIIVFAASIQYFSSFEKIIPESLLLLKEGAEIHILDSYFYKADEIEAAKQRSLSYFRSIGFEEMAEHYFHHAVDSLDQFDHTLLYDPNSIKNKFFGKKDPFPWICIRNK